VRPGDLPALLEEAGLVPAEVLPDDLFDAYSRPTSGSSFAKRLGWQLAYKDRRFYLVGDREVAVERRKVRGKWVYRVVERSEG
jgi:hypothetical protein